jgi:hypothetical protein
MSFTSKTKAAILPVAKKIAPGLVEWRNRRWVGHVVEINKVVFDLCGGKILAGPFEGMQYLSESSGSALAPKLVGCYELEIQPAIKDCIAGAYSAIYDIGCAEGYYAVGLSMKCPATQVIAFDIDEEAIDRCHQLAKMNGVTIHTEAACTKAELLLLKGQRAFIVSDCEGYEFELFDQEVAEALSKCDGIIELHGPADPILEAFAKTHHVQLIGSSKRNEADYPAIQSLAPRLRKMAVSELRRFTQYWAILKSREA